MSTTQIKYSLDHNFITPIIIIGGKGRMDETHDTYGPKESEMW